MSPMPAPITGLLIGGRTLALTMPAGMLGAFDHASLGGVNLPSLLMPCIGLLIFGSLYATRELRALRRQGERLQNQLSTQGEELKVAMRAAHEEAVERDMIEDALKESQQRLYHLTEASFEAICVHDNGVILDFNQNLAELLGYTQDELAKKDLFELYAPESRDDLRRRIRENDMEVYETMVERRDGSFLQVEVAAKAMPYNGRRVRVVAIRDLSARNRHREEQEHSRKQILYSESSRKAILESTVDAILIFGQDDRIEDFNLAAERMFGWRRSELLGRRVAETVVAETHRGNYLRMMTEARGGGEGFLGRRVKVRAIRRDGMEFDSEVTTTAVRNHDRTDYVAAVRDISERLLQQRLMESARDEAIDSARFKSQFLANMSHEIRTPMNAIIGMTDLLLDTPLDAEQKEFTGTVKQASESLLSLINQILDFSKIEAGMMSLEQHDFELGALVEGVANMFAARAQSKGIELALDLPPDLFGTVRGDSARLGQVLVNLVGNAVKFTQSGEVLLRIRREAEEAGNLALKFEVKDTGPGISPEAIPHLFKPFVQADGSITRRFGGTGLGLAISKELVELMGGEIGVTSAATDPKGTCFWFRLALQRQAAHGGLAPLNQVSSLGQRVLIVDDNATNCLVVSRQLNAWMVPHAAADSATAAKEMCHQAEAEGRPFHVLLLDSQLPDQDGLSLAKEIASDPSLSKPRMILMGTLGHAPSKEALTSSSIQACISKPVKQASLLWALQAEPKGSAVAQDPAVQKLRRRDRSAQPGFVPRVLVAEDNMVNQRVIRSQMEKLGVTADIVSNGEDALNAIALCRYDLVFMDCQMPGMDGLSAVRRLRALEADQGQGSHLPVVALTASALSGDKNTCLEAGMDGYLSKPVRLEALEAELVRWTPMGEPQESKHAQGRDFQAPLSQWKAPYFSDEAVRDGMGEHYQEEGLFQDLVEIFSTDTPSRLNRLSMAADAMDCEAVRGEAHAIKGACRSLGAKRLGDSCAELEELGRLGDAQAFGPCLKRINEEYPITLEELLKAGSASAHAA
jgi:two-component system sensor histidine kinase/response regulator